MNYEISQILNFEQCNAGIPLSLVKTAAVNVVRENWQHDLGLAESVHHEALDYRDECRAVNDAFKNAGCETGIDECDLREALAAWVDHQTVLGNC